MCTTWITVLKCVVTVWCVVRVIATAGWIVGVAGERGLRCLDDAHLVWGTVVVLQDVYAAVVLTGIDGVAMSSVLESTNDP